MRLARHHRVDSSSRLSSQQDSSIDGGASLSLKAGSMNLNEMIEPNEDELYEDEEENKAELRIPVKCFYLLKSICIILI